jgi:hypothetical protein
MFCPFMINFSWVKYLLPFLWENFLSQNLHLNGLILRWILRICRSRFSLDLNVFIQGKKWHVIILSLERFLSSFSFRSWEWIIWRGYREMKLFSNINFIFTDNIFTFCNFLTLMINNFKLEGWIFEEFVTLIRLGVLHFYVILVCH